MTGTGKIAVFVVVIAVGAALFAQRWQTSPERTTLALVAENTAQPETPPTVKTKTEAGFLNYDMVIGDRDAPVEIIEYFAISCPHCAHFHADVLPELKRKLLDTGKAKLIYRNFIFNNPFDVFASVLSRCVSEENFFPTVTSYFENQQVWNNLPELQRIFKEQGRDAAMNFAQTEVAKTGKISGISRADARKCYDNPAVIAYLLKLRQDAVETYGVNSTPTLIVAGKKLAANDMASIEEAVLAAGK